MKFDEKMNGRGSGKLSIGGNGFCEGHWKRKITFKNE